MHLLKLGLKIAAPFNTKIAKGVRGRSATFIALSARVKPTDKVIWFHCASLGEYEQGLPLFERLRAHYNKHLIILSFFSPSGYEYRSKSKIADLVVYLPIDTKANAKRFVDLIKPELTIFVKYDIWPNYLKELSTRNLKHILISANFREDQAYFKSIGKNLKNALLGFDRIFVQNQTSMQLVRTLGYKNVTVSGDTRFDRVLNQLKEDNKLSWLSEFKGESRLVICGSTWPEDENILAEFINNDLPTNTKFLLAPHELSKSHIEDLQKKINRKTILYTEMEGANLKEVEVFILNTIGLLAKAYSYADIAYVGGAMGKTGLHNMLEPAVFGIPIIIGKNYEKFPEAIDMIDWGGAFSVNSSEGFKLKIKELLSNTDVRKAAGRENEKFVKNNSGAVIQIMDYLRI